jgi:flagellar hook-length control protein FliK
MQTIDATTATSATTASATAKPLATADAASWQDAVSQATGETTDAAPVTRSGDQKSATKSGDKTAVLDTAAKLAAETQPVLAVAEKTLSQHSKKSAALPAGATTAQGPQHGKDTAKPTVATAVQPVVASVADPSQPSTMPGTGKTDGKADTDKIEASQTDAGNIATGKIDAGTVTAAAPTTATGTPGVAALPDISASATPPAGQSNITPLTPPGKPAGTAHAATLLPASTGTGSPLLAAAATPAGATGTPSTATPSTAASQRAATTTHADKSATTHEAETAVASVSVASGSKTTLTAISLDESPALPVTPADKTDEDSDKPTIGVLPVTTSALAQTTATAQPATVTATAALPVIQPSTAGLAAAVTAMHQAGQSGAVLRLDPPGLGMLSVHVGLAQNGQVNVLFIPSTQDASTALQNNLSGLGAALAQSGITLGQAQVGGQFHQNAGQGGYQPPASQLAVPQTIGFDIELSTPSGVSAYA